MNDDNKFQDNQQNPISPTPEGNTGIPPLFPIQEPSTGVNSEQPITAEPTPAAAVPPPPAMGNEINQDHSVVPQFPDTSSIPPLLNPEPVVPQPVIPVEPTPTPQAVVNPEPMMPNVPTVESVSPEPTPVAEPVVIPEPDPAPQPVLSPEPIPAPQAVPTPEPVAQPTPTPTMEPIAVKPTPVQFEQVVASDAHQGVSLEQEIYPTNPAPKAVVQPNFNPEPLPVAEPVVIPEPDPTPQAVLSSEPIPVTQPVLTPEPVESVQAVVNPEPTPVPTPEPIATEPTPVPTLEPIMPNEPTVEAVSPETIPAPQPVLSSVESVTPTQVQIAPKAIPSTQTVPTTPEVNQAEVPTAQEILNNPAVLSQDYKANEMPLVEGHEEGKPLESTPPKNTVKKKKSKTLLFVLLGVLVLFLGMIGVGVLMLAAKEDPSSNALFTALGIESPSLMTFVFLVTSVVLGFFSFVAFTMGLVYLFKSLKTDKENKKLKKKRLISSLVAFVLMVAFVVGLVFTSSNLNKYKVAPVEEIEFILTNPSETTGLTTPVEIEFSVAELPIDPSQVEIIGYLWDFGDGKKATGEKVSHTYAQKPADGLYQVSLSIQYTEIGKDSVQTETYTKTIAIENESVAAVFTASPLEGRVPLEVTFDAGDSFDPDGEIVNYEWDFDGDGIFEGEGEVSSHVYEEGGEYEVTLRLTDSNGAQVTSSQTIDAKGEDIISFDLKINPDDEFLAPELAYQFDASNSTSDEGKIVKYEWTFGDGSFGEGQKFSHSYAEEGVYTIKTTLTDEADNVRSFETEVKVSKSASGLFARIQTVPEANQSDKTLLGTAPLKVNFSGGNSSGGDIVDYAWDFDSDGEIDANGKTIDHTFTKAGTYNVFLIITSADEKEARETFTVKVESAGLQAKINATPATGVAPVNVTFDASDSSKPDDVEIVSYQWDFGDGTPINKSGSRVTHKYTSIGTFKPSLLIIDSQENFSKVETVIHVNSVPLEACYAMTRKIGPAPLFVEFNPTCSTGAIDSYSWDFAGLGASDKVKPDFTFDVPGTYEIHLEVSDRDNNIAEFSDTVIVE